MQNQTSTRINPIDAPLCWLHLIDASDTPAELTAELPWVRWSRHHHPLLGRGEVVALTSSLEDPWEGLASRITVIFSDEDQVSCIEVHADFDDENQVRTALASVAGFVRGQSEPLAEPFFDTVWNVAPYERRLEESWWRSEDCTYQVAATLQIKPGPHNEVDPRLHHGIRFRVFFNASMDQAASKRSVEEREADHERQVAEVSRAAIHEGRDGTPKLSSFGAHPAATA